MGLPLLSYAVNENVVNADGVFEPAITTSTAFEDAPELGIKIKSGFDYFQLLHL